MHARILLEKVFLREVGRVPGKFTKEFLDELLNMIH